MQTTETLAIIVTYLSFKAASPEWSQLVPNEKRQTWTLHVSWGKKNPHCTPISKRIDNKG
jgi:hypothetical protein